MFEISIDTIISRFIFERYVRKEIPFLRHDSFSFQKIDNNGTYELSTYDLSNLNLNQIIELSKTIKSYEKHPIAFAILNKDEFDSSKFKMIYDNNPEKHITIRININNSEENVKNILKVFSTLIATYFDQLEFLN
jgi:hypothetical protein